MALGNSLLVDLNDLHHLELRPSILSDASTPPEGSALLSIRRFGLSANNISYAANGSALGLWSLFPAPDRWGQIPVWGHATVLRSGHPAVADGDTYFGLLPMATHLLVAPTDVGSRGFTDGSPHRRAAAPVYNRYLDRASDPFAAASPSDALEVLLRPLFTTSFLLATDLSDHDCYGADAVVVTSASCRTALGTAHVLRRRAGRPAIIGLTRGDHMADLRAFGCYDRVLPYEDASSLPVGPTAVVDFSGDGPLVAGLHHRLGESLTHSVIAGATHRGAPLIDTGSLPGAPRTFFYAPQVGERLRVGIGARELEQTLAGEWADFAAAIGDWIRIREGHGEAALRGAYEEVLQGASSPRDGWVLSLGSPAGGSAPE